MLLSLKQTKGKENQLSSIYSPAIREGEKQHCYKDLQQATDLLIQLLKERPKREIEWDRWIARFQSLCIQFACDCTLYERSLLTMFIPCFIYFWFSLSSKQREILHGLFTNLLNPTIPYKIEIIFISMQMSIVDLDVQSIHAFNEQSFPFPFDYIIHLCSNLHFDDSGIRLSQYIFHNPKKTSILTPQTFYDFINMNNRSSSARVPVMAFYSFIQKSQSYVFFSSSYKHKHS